MLAPLMLDLEDANIITNGNADKYFYESGSTFHTTKELLMQCKHLSANDKMTVESLPIGAVVKLETMEMGVFNIVMN